MIEECRAKLGECFPLFNRHQGRYGARQYEEDQMLCVDFAMRRTDGLHRLLNASDTKTIAYIVVCTYSAVSRLADSNNTL